MSLLCLRAAPVDNNVLSPAELLLSRPVQDNLPGKIPRHSTSEKVTSRLIERQQIQKICYDRSAKELPEQAPGLEVTIQDPVTLKGRATEMKGRVHGVPRSHAVRTPAGREVRRCRVHIRKTHHCKTLHPDFRGRPLTWARFSCCSRNVCF